MTTPTSRTNYVFVDYENVQEIDLDRIAGKPVKVTLILGETHKKLATSLVLKVHQYANQVALIETGRAGKNALDLVLALHLGAAKQADPEGFFHILSKDKDFDTLIGYLREAGTFAARHASFNSIPMLMKPAERIHHLTALAKANPGQGPKKRKALESRIQATFGWTLAPADVEATIRALVAAKVITISTAGDVTYTS